MSASNNLQFQWWMEFQGQGTWKMKGSATEGGKLAEEHTLQLAGGGLGEEVAVS